MPPMASFAASTKLLVALSAAGKPRLFEAGNLLFRQGDPVEGLYIVNSGSVRLSLVDSEGVAAPDRTAEQGSVLGLPATMTGAAYSLTAQVIEPSEIIFVERERALALLRDDPALCFEVVEILAQEVSYLRTNALTFLNASNN